MLIPLFLLFFILCLLENQIFEASQQIKFQHLREMNIQYDMYVTTHVEKALKQSRVLQPGERVSFTDDYAVNDLYIEQLHQGENQKTVIWLIDFHGISRQISFIMEIETGDFVKWNYR